MDPITLENAGLERAVLVLAISALASYSLTHIAKMVLKDNALSCPRRRRIALRTLAVILGGTFGYMLAGKTGFGAIIGVGAGSLTTAIFAGVKRKIKAMARDSADF